MAINLVKGENRVLNMNIFHVGLGWDVNCDQNENFDLDVSAFMITINVPTKPYMKNIHV